jgi:hypothetical protein
LVDAIFRGKAEVRVFYVVRTKFEVRVTKNLYE